MSITAMDIQQQGFEHSLRGYDVEQVDDFLERVATEVGAMTAEIDSLKAQLASAPQATQAIEQPASGDGDRIAQAEAAAKAAADQARAIASQAKATEDELARAKATIAELDKKLAEKDTMDSTISNAFISAQRAADSMLTEARNSADALKEEARAEGERIYRESEAKARDFIREALLEKQRLENEIDALSASCDEFRAQYRALVEHFVAEADRRFSDIKPPVVTEAAVSAALPVIEGAPDADDDAPIADDMIEEID